MRHELTWCVAISLVVVACGSDVSTDVISSSGSLGGTSAVAGSAAATDGGTGESGAGSSGSVEAQGGTASEGGGASVTIGGIAAVAGSSACPVTYYRDADADSWGSTETSCTGGVGWVSRTGDCNDSNANVFPNQTKDFDKPYTSSAGLQSFDFDCDGVESIANGSQVATGACTSSGLGNACAGDGYLPVEPVRAGTNLNQICGSTRYLVCSRSQQVCVGATSADGSYPAARCN